MGFPYEGTPSSLASPYPAPVAEDLLTTRCINQMITKHANDYPSGKHGPDAILDSRELREEVARRYLDSGQNLPTYTVRKLESGRSSGELRIFKNGAPAIMNRMLFEIIRR